MASTDIKFFITGSTLKSEAPRDLDLLGVMTASDFKWYFGFTHEEFQEAHRETPVPPKLVRYREQCEGARKILECLFDKRYIDFKFVPDTMPYGDLKETALCDLKTLD